MNDYLKVLHERWRLLNLHNLMCPRSTKLSLTDSRMLSADLCERGYKRVYLPSLAPLVFVSNKFADNGRLFVMWPYKKINLSNVTK